MVKTLYYIPEYDTLQILYDDDEFTSDYSLSIHRSIYSKLKSITKEYIRYDEDSDEENEEEVKAYIIPVLYFIQLVDNDIIRINRWERSEVLSKLKQNIIMSEYISDREVMCK